MFCDGCEGEGAGDGTCAFATGTAAARMAAISNCAHSHIVFSPILRASSLVAMLEATWDKQDLARGFRRKRNNLACRDACWNSMADTWNFACFASTVKRMVFCGAAFMASRLIMFAHALSQELRDDELTVSFDHCSRWEAPQGNETGALTRKATRQTKPLDATQASQRKGACNAVDAHTGQTNAGPIRSRRNSLGSLRDAAADSAVRGTHVLPRPQRAQHPGAGQSRSAQWDSHVQGGLPGGLERCRSAEPRAPRARVDGNRGPARIQALRSSPLKQA